jgi:hypothetical protein
MSDPNEVKDWVVGSSGFWFKGDVNESEYVVPFRGTWYDVVAQHDAMREMEMRHHNECKLLVEQLRERHREEREKLWKRRTHE